MLACEMPLPEADPDLFETKSGGGCLSLFGLPFLLIGLGAVAASVAGAIGDSSGLPLLFGVPFGLIFATVGGSLVFGRAGLRIDRKAGTIEKWWGLLKPMRSKRYALAEVDCVGLFRELRRSKNSTYTVFPVRIALASGAKVDVSAGQVRNKARAEAEALAKFARRPLEDHSEGATTRRGYEELDLSIRDRFRAGSLPGDIPEVPKGLVSRIQFDGARLEIEIPPSGFSLPVAIVALALLAFAGFVATVAAGAMSAGGAVWAAVFAGLFGLLPAAFAVAAFASMFLVRERIVATSEGLERARGWPKPRTVILPAAAIEDIRLANVRDSTGGTGGKAVADGWSIVVETDERTARVGRNLGREEAEYLLALIRATLVS